MTSTWTTTTTRTSNRLPGQLCGSRNMSATAAPGSLRASWSVLAHRRTRLSRRLHVSTGKVNPTVVNIAWKPWARPFSMTDCLVNRERRQRNSTAAGLLAVWNGDSEDTSQVRRVPVAQPLFGGGVLNAAATPITPIMLFGGGALSATALAAPPHWALVRHPPAPDRYGGFAASFSFFPGHPPSRGAPCRPAAARAGPVGHRR